MTKTNLITSINNFITAVVTVAKTRNAFADIVNEIYSPTITDDETTTNVFQRGTIQTKFDYSFTLKSEVISFLLAAALLITVLLLQTLCFI